MPEQQKQKGEHFVVVSTGVDHWRQGDLIAADDPALGYDVTERTVDGSERKHRVDKRDRLLQLGAIRPATEEEARMGRGFATNVPGLTVASQMRLATIDAELDRLRRLVGDQQDRLDSFNRLGVQGAEPARAAGQPDEDPSLAPILDQRRAELEDLTRRAQANEEKLQDLHQRTLRQGDERQAEAQKQAQKDQREPVATGSAPPPEFGRESPGAGDHLGGGGGGGGGGQAKAPEPPKAVHRGEPSPKQEADEKRGRKG
jgi:hypothetical protein